MGILLGAFFGKSKAILERMRKNRLAKIEKLKLEIEEIENEIERQKAEA